MLICLSQFAAIFASHSMVARIDDHNSSELVCASEQAIIVKQFDTAAATPLSKCGLAIGIRPLAVFIRQALLVCCGTFVLLFAHKLFALQIFTSHP